jgi:hypothetical protein
MRLTQPLNSLECIVCAGMLSLLAGCADMSYDYGQPSFTPPTQICAIYLRHVTPSRQPVVDRIANEKDDLSVEQTIASDDVFIARIIKSNVVIDLARRGYVVGDDRGKKRDIDMDIFLFYQPDDWPFANRAIQLRAELYRSDGSLLFGVGQKRTNRFGPVGDFVGFSSDEMLADAARKLTARIAEKMPSNREVCKPE